MKIINEKKWARFIKQNQQPYLFHGQSKLSAGCQQHLACSLHPPSLQALENRRSTTFEIIIFVTTRCWNSNSPCFEFAFLHPPRRPIGLLVKLVYRHLDGEGLVVGTFCNGNSPRIPFIIPPFRGWNSPLYRWWFAVRWCGSVVEGISV